MKTPPTKQELDALESSARAVLAEVPEQKLQVSAELVLRVVKETKELRREVSRLHDQMAGIRRLLPQSP